MIDLLPVFSSEVCCASIRKQKSPVSGMSTYVYDYDDNLTTYTDANSATTTASWRWIQELNLDMATNLGILIPGYQNKFQPDAALTLLKNQCEVQCGALTQKIERNGYQGYSISRGDDVLEFFEVDWQDLTTMLSEKGWGQKLTSGLLLLLTWTFRASRNPRKSAQWFGWFFIGTMIMGLWWFGFVASVLSSVNAGVRLGHFDPNAAGSAMLAWSGWVIISTILAVANINIDSSVDVSDLFRRYMCDEADDITALRIRTLFRKNLDNSLRELYDPRRHDGIVIVAHSFGVLVAIDAFATEPH